MSVKLTLTSHSVNTLNGADASNGSPTDQLQPKGAFFIRYNPALVPILGGNDRAALLLQKLFHLWRIKGYGRQFYKFSAPCKHPWYEKGDSLQEECGFSREKLATALKQIATKITKGVSKKEVESVTEPEWSADGRLLNANRLVTYYTDSNRVTWYCVNTALLSNAGLLNYLGFSGNPHYLEKRESRVIPFFTDAQHRASHTTHTAAQPPSAEAAPVQESVCVSEPKLTEQTKPVDHKSKFSHDEWLEYAMYLHSTGQGIEKPKGYAKARYKSGEDDALLEAWKNGEVVLAAAPTPASYLPPAPPVESPETVCKTCLGTGMEYVCENGVPKGVRRDPTTDKPLSCRRCNGTKQEPRTDWVGSVV